MGWKQNQRAKPAWNLVFQCCVTLCLLSQSGGMEAPEAEMSKAELLDEIGVRQDARSAQQATGLEADESQFIVEPNDALILPSAQHDGIPLGVEDWPVHPEDPVDTYEALRDRLTEAVQYIFPERLDDYAEAYKRASEGVKGLAPILDSSGLPKSANGPRPSVMSEIEDLLVEVSHHGLAKGAELTVEGGMASAPAKPMIVMPGSQWDRYTCMWVLVGWMGSVSVFAIPAGLVYLYMRCTGATICNISACPHKAPRCNHGQPDQDGGPTESVTMYDNEDRAPGPGVDGAGEAGVGNPDYFVVHPYGDSNMAAPYAVDYGTPSVYPVTDAAYNRATYAQVSSGQ